MATYVRDYTFTLVQGVAIEADNESEATRIFDSIEKGDKSWQYFNEEVYQQMEEFLCNYWKDVVSNIQSDGQPYQYIGYYRGASTTTAGSVANATASNGALQKQLNINGTLTTHIPKLRLIVALRIESSLYHYRRSLSELDGIGRGFMTDEGGLYFGEPYDAGSRDKFVIVYPEYYSTWNQPDERIAFAEKFLWAKDNDQQLYNDLSKLVVRSNYAYVMNPNRLSSFFSANLSVTKELGDHLSLSFYANNFFNSMRRVRSTQTNLETSLFESGYIPSYYYGLSLRLKI